MYHSIIKFRLQEKEKKTGIEKEINKISNLNITKAPPSFLSLNCSFFQIISICIPSQEVKIQIRKGKKLTEERYKVIKLKKIRKI